MNKEWLPSIIVGLVLLILAGIASALYLSQSYLPKTRQIAKLETELSKATEQRQLWDAQQKGEIASDVAQSEVKARFNYLGNNSIKANELTAIFLNDLQQQLKSKNIRFYKLIDLGVSPTQGGMTEYRYSLTGKGRYKDILSFMRWLEVERYGIIESWNLPPACDVVDFAIKNKSSQIKTQNCRKRPFTLVWHWLEKVPLNFHSKPVDPDNIKITNLPFKEKRPSSKSVAKKKARAIYHLEAIMSGKHGLEALINGQTLKYGDKVGNMKIVGINPTSVTISGPQGRKVLKMPTKSN